MSKRTDISQQIRKYLNGELNARAMHQLEKEALNDPFLAEALEGYEGTGADQQGNFKDINARLQERIKEQSKRVVLWRTISIAASVIVVLTISGLWLYNQRPAHTEKLMAQINRPAPKGSKISPAIDTAKIYKNPSVIADYNKQTNRGGKQSNPPGEEGTAEMVAPASSADNAPKADTTLIANNNDKIAEYSPLKKKELTGSVSTIDPSQINTKQYSPPVATNFNTSVSSAKVSTEPGVLSNTARTYLAGRTITGIVTTKNDGLPIAAVTVKMKGSNIATQTNAEGKFTLKVPDNAVLQFSSAGYESQNLPVTNKGTLAVAMSNTSTQLGEVVVTSAVDIKKQSRSLGYSTATIPSKETNNNMVTGVVTDKADGQPIPGVIVKIKGTSTGTQTDANGKFTLNGVPDNATLAISFIGYTTTEISTKNKKDLLAVALQQNNSSLSEVVVTGYGTKNNDEEHERQQYQAARPVQGWDYFKKYIEGQVSPDGKAGTVKLSFIVNADNSLSDFTIIKSVSAKTDSVAIELVKAGPQWLSNTYHTAQKVKVKVVFKEK